MELAQILSYVVALGIAAAIPGPGMTALVARTVGSGVSAGFAMLAGLILGDLVYLSFAVFGLAVAAKTFSSVFVVIKWFSIVYLAILAWQFWHNSNHEFGPGEKSTRTLISSLLSGFTITLGNPKTIAFYLALLPLVIDLRQVSVSVWLYVLTPLTVVVLIVVGGVFIAAAHTVRTKLAKKSAQKYLNRGAALAMAGAAGSMAIREM